MTTGEIPHLLHPRELTMTMDNLPFEDVFPIETGHFPCHVGFQGCNLLLPTGHPSVVLP